MSILIDEKTQVVVQGLTGSEGTFHAEKMIEYGLQPGAGEGEWYQQVPFRNW